VTDTGCGTGFAQKNEAASIHRREILSLMTFSVTGHRRSTSRRFVSDPHRTTTQLHRLAIFAHHQFIVLKSLGRLFRCRLDRFLGRRRLAGPQPREQDPCEACIPDKIPVAPESSLPQLGQVRWGSVLMALTAFQPQSESKANTALHRGVRNRPARPWQTVVPFHEQSRVP